jgi:predicted nucleic acid-binding protein
MIVVLDASGAAEIAAKTQNGVDFINILMRADFVLAPDLYVSEISNVMWKIGRRNKKDTDTFMEMANDCIDFIDEYVSAKELWKEALRAAQEYNHPVYDMLYAILAKRNDATVITMDTRLRDICTKMSVRCDFPVKVS